MSERLCGTCKHFDRIVRSPDHGECRLVVLSTETQRPLSDKAWVAGSEDGHLSVRKDFGCVLWEVANG